MKDLAGTRLGNYDIKERLGSGGMAVVYRAVRQPLGREAALKALLPSLIEDQGEEIECGCVTGTAACVFALRSVKT